MHAVILDSPQGIHLQITDAYKWLYNEYSQIKVQSSLQIKTDASGNTYFKCRNDKEIMGNIIHTVLLYLCSLNHED